MQSLSKLMTIMLLCLSWLTAQAADHSGTLPVIFINAFDSITSKTDYVNATYYIDPMGCEGFEPVGTEDNPLPLFIRGHGNWTWTGNFEKKAYRIKLVNNKPLLGMAKNKHFVLLAHADGGKESFFRNTAVFELARQLNLEFTPHQQPVELVLNGEYMGLYFLTENIRVDKGRVEITEQEDGESNPELIKGGWLVEIDNGVASNQIRGNVRNTELPYFLVTYHSPEQLSSEQRTYLLQQVNQMLSAVYTTDLSSTDWENIIDMDQLARFYLVNEMVDNVEAFYGSCYIHKDLEENRWRFGPVWDAGHAFNVWHPKDCFIYQATGNWGPCIMNKIAHFPRFKEYLSQLWYETHEQLYDSLVLYLYHFTEQIAQAAVCDHKRWPQYGTSNAWQSLGHCLELLNRKYAFLTYRMDPEFVKGIHSPTLSRCNNGFYDLQGRSMAVPSYKGIYIRNGKKYINH